MFAHEQNCGRLAQQQELTMAERGNDFHAVLDALKAFDLCRDTPALQKSILSSIARYGYEHASMFAAAASVQHKPSADRVLLSSWPRAWAEEYHQRNFIRDDPVAAKGRIASHSFRWSETIAQSPAGKSIMAAAKDQGLRSGICIPIHNFEGLYAGVSVAGEEVDESESGKFYAELIAIYAFNRLSTINSTATVIRVLTDRQREILTWVAAGKTAWDISVILRVSVHTVNRTIANAMERLRVTTRAQAIAEAIRRGEVAP